MKKKILVVSILAAVIVILASLTPVVGTTAVKSDAGIASPLFAVRSQRSVHKEITKNIHANYLGEGKQLSIVLPKKSMFQVLIDKALKIFDAHPVLLDKLLERMDKMPYVARMLNNHDISKQDIKNYLMFIKNNPSDMVEEIEDIQINFDNIPQPLGLETNDLGCIIIPIVLAPVAVVITLLVLFFTLRIFTCLNVNNCGDDILQGIWEQLIQGLTQG